MFSSWLRQCAKAPRVRASRCPSRPLRLRCPSLEVLEDRTMPAPMTQALQIGTLGSVAVESVDLTTGAKEVQFDIAPGRVSPLLLANAEQGTKILQASFFSQNGGQTTVLTFGDVSIAGFATQGTEDSLTLGYETVKSQSLNLGGLPLGQLLGLPTSQTKTATPPTESLDIPGLGNFTASQFNWGTITPSTSGTGKAGITAKLQAQDFEVTFAPSASEPLLWHAVAIGAHYKQAILEVKSAGQVITWTLSNAALNSFSTSNGFDTISLQFTGIQEGVAQSGVTVSTPVWKTTSINPVPVKGQPLTPTTPITSATPINGSLSIGDLGPFAVQQFNWSETNMTEGTGTGAGKATFQDFDLVLTPGEDDSQLVIASLEGLQFNDVVFTVASKGLVTQWTLSLVSIGSITNVNGAAVISLKVGEIKETTSLAKAGNPTEPGTPVESGSWSQVTNSAAPTYDLTTASAV